MKKSGSASLSFKARCALLFVTIFTSFFSFLWAFFPAAFDEEAIFISLSTLELML